MGAAATPQALLQFPHEHVAHPPQVLRHLRAVPEPLGELRPAALLDPHLPAVRVGLARAGAQGDHRSAARVEAAPVSGGVLAVAGHRQEVAVARVVAPQRRAQAGQRAAAGQQQAVGAERPGGHHDDLPGHRAVDLVRRIEQVLAVVAAGAHVLQVADLVAALGGAHGHRLAAGADLGSLALGRAQVVVVERVLGALVAAHVAFADEAAGEAALVVQVAVGRERQARLGSPRLVGEGDGQRRVLHLQAGRLGRFGERERLGRGGVGLLIGRIGRGREHGLDAVVVRLQGFPVERPLAEAVLRLAQDHVRVDERAAAQPGGHEGAHVGERPEVEQPVQARGRVPEVLAHPARRAGERAGRIGLAALEHQDPLDPRLGQAKRRHRAPESGAHHDCIEVLGLRVPEPHRPPRHHTLIRPVRGRSVGSWNALGLDAGARSRHSLRCARAGRSGCASCSCSAGPRTSPCGR